MTNKDKIFTTLKQIHDHSPCKDDYKKLCISLGGAKKYGKNTPVTFKQIYDSNGYLDALWCLRAVDEKWYPLWRHFACDCADDVRHLITDQRIHGSIDIARRYADGLATDEELYAAISAAWDDDWGSDRSDASASAWFASWYDASADSWHAAISAAWHAASAAASADAKEKQMQRLFEYCRIGERVR